MRVVGGPAEGHGLKLLLVDDHAGVRRGLRTMLELNTAFEVVADVANGLEALQCMNIVVPDVVIMDARMPVMDGAEATRAIKKRWPQVCVFAFSTTGEAQRVGPMLAAGAEGCLLKGQPPEDMVALLRRSVAARNGAPSLHDIGHG